jgi:hypothetical protein
MRTATAHSHVVKISEEMRKVLATMAYVVQGRVRIGAGEKNLG